MYTNKKTMDLKINHILSFMKSGSYVMYTIGKEK